MRLTPGWKERESSPSDDKAWGIRPQSTDVDQDCSHFTCRFVGGTHVQEYHGTGTPLCARLPSRWPLTLNAVSLHLKC